MYVCMYFLFRYKSLPTGEELDIENNLSWTEYNEWYRLIYIHVHTVHIHTHTHTYMHTYVQIWLGSLLE